MSNQARMMSEWIGIWVMDRRNTCMVVYKFP